MTKHTTTSTEAMNAEIVRRIPVEDGGTVFASDGRDARGWIVAVTNAVVRDDLEVAVAQVRRCAILFALLNPAIATSLVIGWWRSAKAVLYIDLGLIVPSRELARAVAVAFRQKAVARIDDGRALICNADVGTAEPEPSAVSEVFRLTS